MALSARSVDGLERVAVEIRSMGRRAVAIPCDVERREEVVACVACTCRELGCVDVLVNNAGGPVFQAPFLDVRDEGWNRVLNLNLGSAFRFCQEAARGMVERQSGSIINVASVLPTRGWPAIAAYTAAKAAVINLTQTLAVAWGSQGVRVNAICPGWIQTEINRAYLTSPVRSATAIEAVPMGRWGEPDDLTGTAIWLASSASRYVTGAIIPVDGGLAVGIPERWQQVMRVGERSLQ